jgi:hypothetical protein
LDKEIEELERELEKEENELMPNYEQAHIPIDKLINYALNKKHRGGGKDKV